MCGCAIFAFAVATTSAQTNVASSGKCGKPDVEQSIPAGDQAGHVFMLAQGKCALTGDINGAASKEGAFSERREITGTHLKAWGVFVATMDSGDKIYYTYQATATMKEGSPMTGGDKWQATGGTGKMKGIKGSGTCKLSGNANGSWDFTCTGDYTPAGAAAATK